MGLFGKLFKKKKQDEPKEFDLGDGMFANDKGEVYGEFQLKTSFNGQEFVHKFPINTTVEKLKENYEQNEIDKANPDSCEREPNEDEVKFPRKDIDKYLPVICEFENIWNKQYAAIFNGYNNIIISKREYEALLSRFQQHNDLKMLQSKVYGLLDKGKQLEKDGDVDSAKRYITK